jgi:hypothetical protein
MQRALEKAYDSSKMYAFNLRIILSVLFFCEMKYKVDISKC